MAFWVIGGEYTDTSFTHIKGGDAETKIGPFPDYETAKSVWGKLAWEHVDDAHTRYRIWDDGSEQFWVVGGTYKSTDFSETVDGSPENRIGPFESYEAAKAEWQKRAWESVDDAHTRYRIEKVSG
ncbi:DUF4170 domain-containing protein [Nisaea acidiphila]|uniref:DUF4170 domain-containing protein n=1 Tax=Nisaea acidiphila TaxID=1862145 RepID=A0A9J7AM55_9PROT|nr:DUF4170 domain-containing protein [Nisaea acidiphila]UUX48247.1 DUF4170 domain-containing protein [Nisaea acidiphila]